MGRAGNLLQRINLRHDFWKTSVVLLGFIGDIETENPLLGNSVQPLVEEGCQQGRVRGGGDRVAQ
ncbi:MAG: hypothetical protein C4583_13160 [Anaerolineaceae bacterium]|nr:MAG: hypothetical protein C4583_13160 [Anaerolineaceae bacterium]